ncbi:L-asparagine oxygenase, partial [Streptomyces laculatispora]|nr:L-asparagine oxygenase [Streptomyces laculatispora]
MPETTPGTTQPSAVADWTLDPADTDACERLALTLCTGGHDHVDNPEWVARSRDAWENLPLPLRREVRRFRRHSGPHGTMVIGGLPVDQAALPATPSVPGSVQRQTSVSAAVLTMVACGLGEPLAYRAEKSGALVQDVVPVPGQETFHGNAGSVPLSFHTENGFHPHPPDYVIFLCLRADHDRRAG